MKLKAQPYHLKNIIQHYAWGTKGKNAFIPKLLNIKAEKNKPYAELWMGAHPKASSKIVVDGKEVELAEVIYQYPQQMLGRKTAKSFSNTLPFLFKVLSVNEALSIQVHPDKKQAIALNKKDPINYPDNNQKVEIAVALDSLTALYGFKPATQIIKMLKDYPEIADFIGARIDINPNKKNLLKQIFTRLIKNAVMNTDGLSNALKKLYGRISRKKVKTEIEKYFLKLHRKYENDVGLLILFFLNLVKLKRGEAVFTKPGVPHAYLKGNILECMSNSDNVIRAGLTPKFKDIDSLLGVLRYESNFPKIIRGKKRKNLLIYQTDAKEFQLQIYNIDKSELKFKDQDSPRILLVLRGEVKVNYLDDIKRKSMIISKGESAFFPSSFSNFTITPQKISQLVIVTIPHK